MDKLKKAFQRLSKEEQKQAVWILEQLARFSLEQLDDIKLSCKSGYYRAKKGRVRVIFSIDWGKKTVQIIQLKRRSEMTYRKF